MSKVWFITGASKGIGKAIALAALKNGNFVVATTRKSNGFEVPAEYARRVLAIQLDVSNTNQNIFDEAVKKTAAAFGRIDVLVNDAGYGSVTFFEETDEETIRKRLVRRRFFPHCHKRTIRNSNICF